jgi:aminotransferase
MRKPRAKDFRRSSPRPKPAKPATKHFLSDKVSHFTESVIREMTRQAMLYSAVNLAQGFPDFSAPAEIKQAAQQAVAADINQYAITWGAKNLRNAIARQMGVWQGITVDPEKEITVCCGSTEAMISTLLAVCNAGDEVVIFEPFYENYGPDAILSGAKPRFVKLRPPTTADGEWTFDERELRAAFHNQTKAIIVNTPNNPTGKVFTRSELELIRDLCMEFNVLAITDEIYEHILYDGTRHISMAALDGMRDRTITINGLSKTYSVTGWRVGWAVAPPAITDAIRKVHDFLTVGAPAPLQEAGVAALAMPESY